VFHEQFDDSGGGQELVAGQPAENRRKRLSARYARLTMKKLLVVTAVLELATGLALMTVPDLVVEFLLGAALETPPGLTIGRIAGATLLSLGVACWLGRDDDRSRAGAGLLTGLSAYNGAVAALLAYANVGLNLSGVALWPAVLGHLALLAWCIACLNQVRVNRVR
jgi:hypothetical protein